MIWSSLFCAASGGWVLRASLQCAFDGRTEWSLALAALGTINLIVAFFGVLLANELGRR